MPYSFIICIISAFVISFLSVLLGFTSLCLPSLQNLGPSGPGLPSFGFPVLWDCRELCSASLPLHITFCSISQTLCLCWLGRQIAQGESGIKCEAHVNEFLFLLGSWLLKSHFSESSTKSSSRFLKSIFSSLSSFSWLEDQSILVCHSQRYLPWIFMAKTNNLIPTESLGLGNSPLWFLANVTFSFRAEASYHQEKPGQLFFQISHKQSSEQIKEVCP